MKEMREIGRRIKAEQGLTSENIAWLVGMAKAILRAFVWDEGQSMRSTADELEISPQTLYTKLRQAIQVLMLVRRGKQSVETLTDRVQELQDRLAQVEQAYANAQAQVQRLTKRLVGIEIQVVTLQAEVTRLQAQWTLTKDRFVRVAAKVQNPYVRDMGTFLDKHRVGLLAFYACLESSQHTLKRLSRSQQKWVPLTKRWAVPIISNAAEHVFRCLRRYTNQMDHFGSKEASQRFFDLFAFYHNVHILRAGKREGNSLLASAHVNVKKIFGTDDPYTMMGFPLASRVFTPVKSVQSVGG